MLNWILPLAGRGKRTRELGKFKPFVKVNGKYILEWFFIGLKAKLKLQDKIYLITTKEIDLKCNFKKKVKDIFKKNKIKSHIFIHLLDNTPDGPGFTVNEVVSKLNKSKNPTIVINADQFIDFEFPKKINKNNIYLPLHFNYHGNSSYVKIEKNKLIKGIFEKKLISGYASSGIYIFGSVNLIKSVFKNLKKIKYKKELNLSHIINFYLKKNNKKIAEPLETFAKYDLGNLKSIKNFKYKKIIN